MLFTAEITTPAGTAQTSPIETIVKVSAGTLETIEVHIPQGTAGTCYLTINQGGHQIIPATQGMSITGNGETIRIPEILEIKPKENILTIKTWADSAVYDHRFQVRLFIRENKEQSTLKSIFDLLVKKPVEDNEVEEDGQTG